MWAATDMEAMVILLTSDVQIADLRRRRILSIVRSAGDGCRMEINMAKKQKTIRTCFGNAIVGVVGLEKMGFAGIVVMKEGTCMYRKIL